MTRGNKNIEFTWWSTLEFALEEKSLVGFECMVVLPEAVLVISSWTLG
jgi:hypothetical protein